MKHYDEFIRGLQKDVEVPEGVWEKFHDTLTELPDIPHTGKRHTRHWMAAVASAAVILGIGTGFCYANPVAAKEIASKIPVIGNLFEQVEEDVTFSGDYSEKSEILTHENTEQQDGSYTAESQGVKITASEIYCDGYSIFMTAKIQAEIGKMMNIPSTYSGSKADSVHQTIYTRGNWSVKDQTKSTWLENNNFEGQVVDDHTFIGMMKIDIDVLDRQNGVLELQLNQIGYDDVTEMDSEDISASHKVEGEWKLSVPFNVDTETAREIPVGQKTDDGYGIDKIFISPYQVVVYSEVPHMTMADVDDSTKEEFEKMWGDKMSGTEPPYTYEEYMAQRYYPYIEVAVFNQDGAALEARESDFRKSVFAVKNLDIKKLHIFFSNDEANMFSLVKAQSIDEAREISVLEVEVNIE